MPIALIYHDVADPADPDRTGFSGPVAARYKLSPNDFRAHLDAIAATGATVEPISSDVQDPPTDVWLTFDDGGLSAMEIADELESRGWRGRFFVISGKIGETGYMDSKQILALHGRGHMIGSHSDSHPTYMGKLSRSELDAEWGRSRNVLGALLGESPAAASVPGGYTSREVLHSAAAAGYSLLLTSEPDHHPRLVGGMTVLGRYAVWATTPAATVAAYAKRNRLVMAKLTLAWKVKRAAKVSTPGLYERLRKLRA